MSGRDNTSGEDLGVTSEHWEGAPQHLAARDETLSSTAGMPTLRTSRSVGQPVYSGSSKSGPARRPSTPRSKLPAARELKCRANHLQEDVTAEHAVTPHRIQICQRFARHYLLGRFPGGLQFLDAIADHNQHVPALGQIGFVPQRSMPRNDLGVVVGQGQNFFRRRQSSR